MGQINVGKGLDVPDLGTTCRALPAYSLFTTADKRWVYRVCSLGFVALVL